MTFERWASQRPTLQRTIFLMAARQWKASNTSSRYHRGPRTKILEFIDAEGGASPSLRHFREWRSPGSLAKSKQGKARFPLTPLAF
jgi:hypothetical protein